MKRKSGNSILILHKLGLTEEDVRDSEKLFMQIPPPPPFRGKACCSKEECLLGYNVLRLHRAKALRVLGASEEDVDIENAKNLGSLGRSGRKRSFVVKYKSLYGNHEYKVMSRLSLRTRHRSSRLYSCFAPSRKYRKKSQRRRSTSDLSALRNAFCEVSRLKQQNEKTNIEIDCLKKRLQDLENEVKAKSLRDLENEVDGLGKI